MDQSVAREIDRPGLACRLHLSPGMAAISSLFRRLGYAKLDDYGLVLTPDERILSTRSGVLDDGLGGKIVGWREGDLAAMELERWEPMQPATGRAAARPLVMRAGSGPGSVPRPIVPEVASPIVRPRVSAFAPTEQVPTVIATPPPVPRVAPRPPPQFVHAPIVAARPVVEEDEDEWEWEIAMARARAAAEWAEEGIAMAMKPAAPARSARTTAPIAVVAARPDPIVTDTWPKTEPLSERWQFAAGSAPVQTVIPVPELHRASDSRLPPRAPIAAQPKRYPRATGRVDDTIRTHAATAANDDKTSPNIALPPASWATKRVAAKQR